MTEEMIANIIRRVKDEGGITVDILSMKIIDQLDEWLFPKYPDLTSIVPAKRLENALVEFVGKNKQQLHADTYLGIWRGEDGMYYIDANAHIKSIEDARRLARTYSQGSSRNIISAYNPALDRTEYFDN